MYKVFLNERVVFITGKNNKTLFNSPVEHANPAPHVELVNGLKFDSFDNVEQIEKLDDLSLAWESFIRNDHWKKILLYSDSSEHLLSLLFTFFIRIDAAGGVVLDNKKRLLCIKRFGKWDLPKGKVEKGEAFRLAAMREVKEETGIDALAHDEPHITTYHIYKSPYHNHDWVIKPTHWFKMKCENSEGLLPQIEEDITEVKWFSENEINEILQNTYESLIDVFQFAYAESV